MKATLMISGFLGLFFTGVVLANTPKTLAKLQYSADKIIQNKEADSIQLEGHAKIIKGDKVITGQKISLNLKTGSVVVTGDALYSSENMTIQLDSKESGQQRGQLR